MTRRRGHIGRGAGGYSLIEVLVAIAILGIAMGTAYGSVIVQMRRHAAQAMVSETLYAGRTAFQVLTEQVANAGFGVPTATTPSAAASIVAAEPARLSFWTNVGTTHTYLTAAALTGSFTMTVLSSHGLGAGANVYVTDSNRWVLGTVQSASGTTVQLSRALGYNFAAGSLVFPVEQVTYDFDAANGALRRNGRALIPNVTDLLFTYDSATPERIRVITISLTVQTRGVDLGGTRRAITLGARVAPPNLAL